MGYYAIPDHLFLPPESSAKNTTTPKNTKIILKKNS